MTRKQLEDILTLIFKEKKSDEKKQDSIDNLVSLFAENEYPPIFTGTTVKLLKVLEILNPEVEDWVSYFLYEAPSFYKKDGFVKVTFEDKVNIISCDTEAIFFILNKIYQIGT